MSFLRCNVTMTFKFSTLNSSSRLVGSKRPYFVSSNQQAPSRLENLIIPLTWRTSPSGNWTGSCTQADKAHRSSNIARGTAERLIRREWYIASPPNDEVERRGAASNEGTLSQSSNPSLAHRRRAPRSLEPIVMWRSTANIDCRRFAEYPIRATVLCQGPQNR